MAAAGAFLETYLDCVESLPGDLSRDITELRCIDMERTRSALKELENCCEELKPNVSENDKKDLSSRIRRALLEIRKIGDTKMNVVSSMQETAEEYCRRLDISSKHFEKARIFEESLLQPYVPVNSRNSINTVVSIPSEQTEKPKKMENSGMSNNRGPKRQRQDKDEDPIKMKEPLNNKSSNKKKTSKVKRNKQSITRENAPVQPSQNHQQASSQSFTSFSVTTPMPDFTTEPIDPNEPTYCLCNQVSFGEMIGCDNDECPIEWFHFQCVQLTSKPKGKWYCPICRRQDYKNSKGTR